MNELQTYIQIGRRNWWIIALTAGIALLASIILSSLTEPTYQTQARFIVSPNSTLETDRDIIDSLDVLDKRSVVVTYAEVLRSTRIIDAARKKLNIEVVELAGYAVTAVVLPEANVLELTVSGPNPTRVAGLANNIGEETIAYMSNLYKIHRFDFLDKAPVPQLPSAPQPLQNALLSVALGLGLGGLLIVIRERLLQPTSSSIPEIAAAQENTTIDQLTDLEKTNQSIITNGSVHDVKTAAPEIR
jgi:capsular polysaccharide biosynthesis protein